MGYNTVLLLATLAIRCRPPVKVFRQEMMMLVVQNMFIYYHILSKPDVEKMEGVD